MIAIFTLTSPLHDENSVARVTQEFLESLKLDFTFMGNNFDFYGRNDLDLIYVRTGGSESVFLQVLPLLRQKSPRPIYLLTNGKSNSLAASMEILSYLNNNGLRGEILHGSVAYLQERINNLMKTEAVAHRLIGQRLGVVGTPSDWLISSYANTAEIKNRLGIDLISINMRELIDRFNAIPNVEPPEELSERATSFNTHTAIADAHRLYLAMKSIVTDYELSGFTIRCFDLLSAVHNTGCWALAKLNAEDKVAGCEGDIPAMLSMVITRAITGVSGFQANPALIDPETGTVTFAHCTIPLNLAGDFQLDTHYESGIGIGIRGFMNEGPVTILKVSGDLNRHFVAQGTLLRNESKPDLCRTQQVIKLDNPAATRYFLTEPIGNHHIIVPGHHTEEFKNLLNNV